MAEMVSSNAMYMNTALCCVCLNWCPDVKQACTVWLQSSFHLGTEQQEEESQIQFSVS